MIQSNEISFVRKTGQDTKETWLSEELEDIAVDPLPYMRFLSSKVCPP